MKFVSKISINTEAIRVVNIDRENGTDSMENFVYILSVPQKGRPHGTDYFHF